VKTAGFSGEGPQAFRFVSGKRPAQGMQAEQAQQQAEESQLGQAGLLRPQGIGFAAIQKSHSASAGASTQAEARRLTHSTTKGASQTQRLKKASQKDPSRSPRQRPAKAQDQTGGPWRKVGQRGPGHPDQAQGAGKGPGAPAEKSRRQAQQAQAYCQGVAQAQGTQSKVAYEEESEQS